MNPHYNNLINAFLVSVDIRPASLVQIIDYKNIEDSYVTLEKIKELFPALYHIPNYQGIIISKLNISDIIDNHEKLGNILGYPCKNDFTQIINENISGYIIEIICFYYCHGIINKSQIIVNRCITLNKLNDFEKILKEANQYIGYQINDIEIIKFTINYEKIYNTSEVLNHVYNNHEINPDIIYHIGNIIWNMGITEDNEIIDTLFHYHNWFHRFVICSFLYLDIIMDKYSIVLPNFLIKPIRWVLKILLT